MEKLVVVGNAALMGVLAATKGGRKKGSTEPTLLLVELRGVELPAEFTLLPNVPPAEINFGEMDKAIERSRKAADELEDATNDIRRHARKARTMMLAGRSGKEAKAAL